MLPFEEVNAASGTSVRTSSCPVRAPRLVTRDQVDRMSAAGLDTLISSGANVPFADPEIFYGPIAEHADGKLSVIPDFIANCGMARVFAYCMQPGAELTDKAIFEDVSEVIGKALEEVHGRNGTGRRLSATAFEIALHQLHG
jgi:glutamate dehydrogenase/leucine dehydrogenase